MNMANLLPHRWRSRREIGRHNAAILPVLETPPIVPKADGLVLFGMIGSNEVLPFLVALKSLWSHLQRGRVVILDDGSLAAQDRTILARHCGDPQILRLQDVPQGPFPATPGWQRLLTITDHRAGEYWLDLPWDTVTLSPVFDIERAIDSNRSFAMRIDPALPERPLPLAEFCRRAYSEGPSEDLLQARLESRLDLVPPDAGWRYVGGLGGVTGFAAGHAGRELATTFYRHLVEIAGSGDAAGSGSEDVMRNLILANQGRTLQLPPSRYARHTAAPLAGDPSLTQFTGEYRHEEGAYLEASLKAIALF